MLCNINRCFELSLMEKLTSSSFCSQYRASFPSSIKEYAVFADIAPRFKLMAEEVLQRQVQLVISSLQEVSFRGN